MHGYHVGINIHVASNATMMMGQLAHAMHLAQGQTSAFQKKLEQLHTTMNRLAAVQVAGNAMFSFGAGGLSQMIEPAKEYAKQLNLMNMAGMNQVEIANNIKTAWEQSHKVMAMSPTGALSALGDLRMIFGSDKAHLEEARRLLPEFMKMKAIMTAATHDGTTGHTRTGQIFSAVKALEMKGLIRSEAEMKHHLEEMTRSMVTAQGTVMPSDFQSYYKFARQGKLAVGEEFMYRVFPELALEMKSGPNSSGSQAGGPGAMYSAFYSQVVQGNAISKLSMSRLKEYDMAQGKFVKNGFGGNVTGGLYKAVEAGENPFRWVNTDLVGKMIAKHPEWVLDRKTGKLDDKAITHAMGQLNLNKMTTSLILELFNKRAQLGNYIDPVTGKENVGKLSASFDRVGNVESLYKLAMQDPYVAEEMLSEAWKTLMISIGQVMIPFIPYLNQLSAVLHSLAQFFMDNPMAAQLVVVGLAVTAVVGALMAFAAGIALIIIPAALMGATFGQIAAVIGAVVGGIVFLTGAIVVGMNLAKMKFGEFAGFLLNLAKPLLMAVNPVAYTAAEVALAKVLPKTPTETADASGKTKKAVPATKPPVTSQSSVNQKNVVSIAQGAINIVASENHSPSDIAKAVMDELTKMAQNSFLTGGGMGLMNSPALVTGGDY